MTQYLPPFLVPKDLITVHLEINDQNDDQNPEQNPNEKSLAKMSAEYFDLGENSVTIL